MSMKYEFPEEVSNLLRKVGWTEERCVNLSEVEIKLNNVGIELFSNARLFLEEFNGLVITSPEKTTLYIDALKGLSCLQEDDDDIEQVKYLDKIIGKKLCPIGLWGDEILFISNDGEIVYLWVWETVTVCNSFQEMLKRYYVNMSTNVSCYSFDLKLEQIPPSWKD
jgi:hypothetical protein